MANEPTLPSKLLVSDILAVVIVKRKDCDASLFGRPGIDVGALPRGFLCEGIHSWRSLSMSDKTKKPQFDSVIGLGAHIMLRPMLQE